MIKCADYNAVTASKKSTVHTKISRIIFINMITKPTSTLNVTNLGLCMLKAAGGTYR